MREFKALAGAAKNDRVLADHVAFANRLDWNFALRFFSCFQNFSQCFGRSAWRIFFHLVMCFDNLGIKIAAELLRGFARQPKEHIDPDTEIRRKHNWQRPRGLFDYSALLFRMAGRPNDQRLAMLKGSRADLSDSVGVTKIDSHIAIFHWRLHWVAEIAPPD